MTTATRTIDVPLPEGAGGAPEDVEMLRGLLCAITALHYDSGRDWPRIRRALERGGWDLRWSLQWHVEARRGRELEQTCGRTLDEAFHQIWQVTGREEPLEGTP